MPTKTVKVLARYKSRSSDRRYTVVVASNGPITCDCPGFTYHGKCWHQAEQFDKVCDRGYVTGGFDEWVTAKFGRTTHGGTGTGGKGTTPTSRRSTGRPGRRKS